MNDYSFKTFVLDDGFDDYNMNYIFQYGQKCPLTGKTIPKKLFYENREIKILLNKPNVEMIDLVRNIVSCGKFEIHQDGKGVWGIPNYDTTRFGNTLYDFILGCQLKPIGKVVDINEPIYHLLGVYLD